eukprot:1574865-Lingulodinium_polyedra.AAC.1
MLPIDLDPSLSPHPFAVQLQLANFGGMKILEPHEVQNLGEQHRATFAIDLGSDGLSAINYAQRCKELNIDVTPDVSHLTHRGLEAALKHAGL